MASRKYKENYAKIDWSKPIGSKADRRDDVPVARSSLPCPMIISDNMDALRHPATGLWSDSKSAFRKMTKASGCIEVGDQAPTEPGRKAPKLDKAQRVQDIKKSLRQHGVDIL